MTCSLLIPVLGNAEQVKADGLDEVGQIVDGSVLTTDAETESTYNVYARSSLLNYGTVKLSDLGNRVVSVGGSTVCHRTCTTVRLYMILQRKVNGSWTNYRTWQYTANNTSLLSRSIQVSVAGGYYYRAIGSYSATYGSTESGSSTTNGIWIP
ncbi:MAG: DUF6147 family protein [Lachnospiraceae bacterium]|nr:DUF6147 family protein [Lachnospiraceae bacterium]